MALIESADYLVEISTDAGTTWKKLVCEETSSASKESTVNTRSTKCGVFSLAGEKTASYDYTGAVKASPAVGEASYKDLQTLWLNGTSFLIRRETPVGGATLYEKAEVFISSLGDESAVDEFLTFSVTFTVSDTTTIDFTA